MTGCLNESTLQAWLDGELSPEASAAARSHLAACAVCAAQARAAENALALVDAAWQAELPRVVPAARLGARVEEGLTAPPARVPARVNDRLWWWDTAFAHWRIGAATAVLAIAVAGGVAIPPPQHVSPASPQAAARSVLKQRTARPASLESETSRHLEQTQLLLRSVRNAETGSVADLAYERELSRELLSRNRLLRRSAERRGAERNDERRAEALLSEIEPLLLDIANLPEQPAPEDMRSLKELIRGQQIIAELQLYAGTNLF
jgi:hypothetical protein